MPRYLIERETGPRYVIKRATGYVFPYTETLAAKKGFDEISEKDALKILKIQANPKKKAAQKAKAEKQPTPDKNQAKPMKDAPVRRKKAPTAEKKGEPIK